MYQRHPSNGLNQLFVARPWQGVAPEAATFLFVGLDANYDEALETSESFGKILEYHEDGVAFWQRHRVHHPFLLPDYRGDGRRYHSSFARIGFSVQHAPLVSFAEVLHVPTVGRNRIEAADLDRAHLRWLNSVMVDGSAKHVFVSDGVAGLMRSTGAFPWLPRNVIDAAPLPLLHRDGQRTVYQILHFSNYGKFQARLTSEAAAIRELAEQSPIA